MEWQLQHAKTRFSELVKRTVSDGPQMVTVQGRPAAVILSMERYRELTADRPSFTEFLLSGEPWPDDLVDAVNDRLRDPPRDLEF